MNKLGVEQKNVRLLRTMYFAFFTTGMISTLLGAIQPNLKETYNISYLLTGSAYSFHQIGNLCAVLLAGVLPYAIGRKKSTAILYSCLIVGVTLITFAGKLLALTGTPVLLLLAYMLTGVGRGTTSNITNVVVADTTQNKTAGLNILHAVFACGALLSPFILVMFSLMNHSMGWRITLWLVAVLMLTVFFLFISSSMSNKPEQKKTPAVSASGSESEVPFYKSFDYWINVAILLFYLCGESANMGWLVTYFKDTGLMGQSFAQMTSSIMWIMIMAGRLMCASISGKINKNKLVLILAGLNAFFFVLMISTRCMPVIIIGLLGMGFSMSGIYPTTLSTMKPEYNASPLAVGLCIGIATTGAISMPMIVGAIAQNVTKSAVASGLTEAAAENKGVTSGISAIAFALAIMVVLNIVKYVLSRRSAK